MMRERARPGRRRRTRPGVRPGVLAGAGLLGAVTLAAASGCSAGSTASTFVPQGGATAAAGDGTATAAASAGFTMPPFGSNVRIEMTSWQPTGPNEARAVTVAKDYELAFLYAEYKSGQDYTWVNYVSPTMRTAVQ